MGRFQKRRKGGKKGDGGGGGKKRASNDEHVDAYVSTIVDKGNYRMEVYYAAQGLHSTRWNKNNELVPCSGNEEKEAERMSWRSTVGTILPSSFRFAKDVPAILRVKLESELEAMLEASHKKEGEREVTNKLKFLPHAYQLEMDRTSIRKNPDLAALHEWLKQQTQAGYISRQETVSMVPPVVLSVEPNDRVLDMCAAPGSKTSQILEDLGPRGCIVANDANCKRAHMLVTQLRRIMHMNPGVLVTCCSGQFFPACTQFDRILCDVPCSGDGTSRKNISVWREWTQMNAMSLHALQVDIAWKGISQLLKVGGYMCYSTCSFNPTENEAVVAELLRRAEGSLELVDCKLEGFKTRPGWTKWHVFCEDKTRREQKNSENKNNEKMKSRKEEYEEKQQAYEEKGELSEEQKDVDKPKVEHKDSADSEAKSSPGPKLENHTPAASKAKAFKPESMDAATLIEMVKAAGMHHFQNVSEVPVHLKRRVRSSIFPPTEEEDKKFNLQRCIRCLPQDNDTGGFFVALLRKTGELSKTDHRGAMDAQAAEEASSDREPEPVSKRTKVEEAEDKSEIESVEDDDIAAVDKDNEAVRGLSKGNFIRDKDGNALEMGRDDFIPVGDDILDSLVDTFGLTASNFERDLLMTRASGKEKIIYYIPRSIKDLIDQGLQKRVTVVNAGLKAFARSSMDGQSHYRVCQEAAHFLARHMTKRKLVVGLEDFRKCLTEERYIEIEKLSESLQAKVRELSTGAFVLVLDGYEDQLEQKMVACLWRCRSDRLDGLVAKVEVKAMNAKLDALQLAT